MRQQKKNKFFTFIFSLMPGAAEMYVGFMKYGISLMGLFFASCMVTSLLRLDDIAVMIPALVWFYSFFHARNLVAAKDEVFYNITDEFIWESFAARRNIQISNPTLRKWVAGILIVCGVVILWRNFASIIYNFIPDYLWTYVYPVMEKVPQVAVAVIIIIIGMKLIAGKKEEMNKDGK